MLLVTENAAIREIKPRDPYWDIVKGIAILLVILGHAVFAVYGHENSVHEFIYSFHMPLFMVVAGRFFYSTLKRRTTIGIIRSKFIQLILPILVIGLIDFLFFGSIHFNLKFKPDAPLMENLMHLYGTWIRTLWFLQALFLCSMTALAADRLTNNSIWAYLATIVAVSLLPDWLNSASFKQMLPCFVFGLFLQKYEWREFFIKHRRWCTAASCIAFALLLIPFRYCMYYQECGGTIFGGPESPAIMAYWFLIRTATGIAGSAAMLCVIHLAWERSRGAFVWMRLSGIGLHTLTLYIISYYLWIAILGLPEGWIERVGGCLPAVILTATLLFAIPYPAAIWVDSLIKKWKKQV